MNYYYIWGQIFSYFQVFEAMNSECCKTSQWRTLYIIWITVMILYSVCILRENVLLTCRFLFRSIYNCCRQSEMCICCCFFFWYSSPIACPLYTYRPFTSLELLYMCCACLFLFVIKNSRKCWNHSLLCMLTVVYKYVGCNTIISCVP